MKIKNILVIVSELVCSRYEYFGIITILCQPYKKSAKDLLFVTKGVTKKSGFFKGVVS
jgi:hypothetical protein